MGDISSAYRRHRSSTPTNTLQYAHSCFSATNANDVLQYRRRSSRRRTCACSASVPARKRQTLNNVLSLFTRKEPWEGARLLEEIFYNLQPAGDIQIHICGRFPPRIPIRADLPVATPTPVSLLLLLLPDCVRFLHALRNNVEPRETRTIRGATGAEHLHTMLTHPGSILCCLEEC